MLCFALLCFALLSHLRAFALLLASADADADVEACWACWPAGGRSLISAPRAAYTYTYTGTGTQLGNSRSDAPGENGSSVLPVLGRVAEIAH
jgi:hypothetical protein